MENRIRTVTMIDKRLDPTEAEVHVAVYPEQLNVPGTEIKGRLMGPSCPYSSTIEVAYHLREVSRAADHILLRAIIPEPCLWDLQSPFLYHVLLELWQDGQRCVQTRLTHGLCQVRLTAQGLRVNGKALTLRGTSRLPRSEAQARELHDRGYNLLLAAAPAEDVGVWDLGDQFGFLVLTRAAAPSIVLHWEPECRAHPSALGWVMSPERFGIDGLLTAGPNLPCVGLELHVAPVLPPPACSSFIVCDSRLLPALSEGTLPKFVAVDDLAHQASPAPARVLGWIER